MAEKFTELAQSHIEFIQKQKIYFVGTAGTEGVKKYWAERILLNLNGDSTGILGKKN